MADKEFLDLIIRSQEKISDRLSDIEKTQVAQHETLKEHTRRSLANEEAVAITKAQIKPLEEHVLQVRTVLKISGVVIAVISGLVGVSVGVVELIKYLKELF